MLSKDREKKYHSHFTVRSGTDRRSMFKRRKGWDIDYFRFGGTPRRVSPYTRRSGGERRRNWPILRLEAPLSGNGSLDREGMFPSDTEK